MFVCNFIYKGKVGHRIAIHCKNNNNNKKQQQKTKQNKKTKQKTTTKKQEAHGPQRSPELTAVR